MAKPTAEEREAYTVKQLKENPGLTREQVESWDKIGRRAYPGEIQAQMARKDHEQSQPKTVDQRGILTPFS